MTARRRPLPLWRVARAHPVLAGLSVLALVVCLMFVLRLGMLLWTGGPEAWANHPVEGWMTPGFLVRAHDLPPDALAQVLGAEPAALRGKPLAEIARDQNRPLPDLIAAIEALRRP